MTGSDVDGVRGKDVVRYPDHVEEARQYLHGTGVRHLSSGAHYTLQTLHGRDVDVLLRKNDGEPDADVRELSFQAFKTLLEEAQFYIPHAQDAHDALADILEFEPDPGDRVIYSQRHGKDRQAVVTECRGDGYVDVAYAKNDALSIVSKVPERTGDMDAGWTMGWSDD